MRSFALSHPIIKNVFGFEPDVKVVSEVESHMKSLPRQSKLGGVGGMSVHSEGAEL